MDLQNKIDNINNLSTVITINNLLDIVTKNKEFATCVYVYDYMLKKSIKPNEETFKFIDRLHSKTVSDNNSIRIPPSTKRTLQPRRRIHKIMKGYNYSDKYSEAKEYLCQVIDLFKKNDKCQYLHKDKLAKLLSKDLNVNISLAKTIVTVLKRNNMLKEKYVDVMNVDLSKKNTTNVNIDQLINLDIGPSKIECINLDIGPSKIECINLDIGPSKIECINLDIGPF
jgi:pentatricopeptide repeat protein